MPHRSLVRWLLLCAACLVTSPAYADGMRCGSKLVSDGDSLHDVRSICGVPDATSQRVEYRTVRRQVNGPCFKEQGVLRCTHIVEQTVEVVIDEWTYDFGPHSFVRYLTFEQGRLLNVTTGRYGNKAS